jgi:hypothetical protein
MAGADARQRVAFKTGPRITILNLSFQATRIARVNWRFVMDKFDYNAPAELFPARNRKVTKRFNYRRFDKAAEAIRFAVEELPEPQLLGSFIEIEEKRLGHEDIRALYDSENYPLKKRVN